MFSLFGVSLSETKEKKVIFPVSRRLHMNRQLYDFLKKKSYGWIDDDDKYSRQW